MARLGEEALFNLYLLNVVNMKMKHLFKILLLNKIVLLFLSDLFWRERTRVDLKIIVRPKVTISNLVHIRGDILAINVFKPAFVRLIN